MKRAVGRAWRNVVVGIAAVLVVGVAFAVWSIYFRPSRPPIEPASVDKMALPLPQKPSLAILPFVNMSGDPKQEYLSNGITESLIKAVSRIHNLTFVPRASAGRSPYPTVWVATGMNRQFPGRDSHPSAPCAFAAHLHLVVTSSTPKVTTKLPLR